MNSLLSEAEISFVLYLKSYILQNLTELSGASSHRFLVDFVSIILVSSVGILIYLFKGAGCLRSQPYKHPAYIVC